MTYLVLSADYLKFFLSDEQGGLVRAYELGLSPELVESLVNWNTQYQRIIPLGASERAVEPAAALIVTLDEIGLQLASRIAAEVRGGAKVRYYSEGLLMSLS